MIKRTLVLVAKFKLRIVYLRAHCSTKNMDKCKIAVCQLTSTNDKTENFEAAKRLVLQATKENVKFVFLPEAVDYIAEHSDETVSLSETLDGSLINKYKTLAQTCNVWLSLGGVHERTTADAERNNSASSKLYNSHVVINGDGTVEAVYRKLHLFDVSIPEKNINLKESDRVFKGNEILPPLSSPAGPIGLSICYDLRFPELSTILRKLGACVLTFPSAFTHLTGEAHWETLLRSRAIENQCYVIAAAQFGCHNGKRTSHGHAMVVDPWGKIIANCMKYENGGPTTDESLAIATIDLEVLNKIRLEMPVFNHRRDDMYCLSQKNKDLLQADDDNANIRFKFADKDIPSSTVFYVTSHSFAFTNIRCVVPGHVLIASKRPAKRLLSLQQDEISDLFQTVVKVQKVLEDVYGASSSTVCVQDGEDAGQTVAHVHVHILPRRRGDFERNDDIYDQLAKHDRENSEIPMRSLKEMSDEAQILMNRLK